MTPEEKREFIQKLRDQGIEVKRAGQKEKDEEYEGEMEALDRELAFYSENDLERREALERRRVREFEYRMAKRDELMEKIRAEREENEGKGNPPYGVHGA